MNRQSGKYKKAKYQKAWNVHETYHLHRGSAQRHMRKVPKAFFDYADRGSYAEETLRANRDDLQQIKFRQRILVDVSKRDLSTTILGEPAALPLILAPIGLCGMQHGDGEI